MFTSGVMVIKMSKMVNFLYFLLMPVKNQAQTGQYIYVHLKISYLDLLESAVDCLIQSYH